jgi:hypothetical protein
MAGQVDIVPQKRGAFKDRRELSWLDDPPDIAWNAQILQGNIDLALLAQPLKQNSDAFAPGEDFGHEGVQSAHCPRGDQYFAANPDFRGDGSQALPLLPELLLKLAYQIVGNLREVSAESQHSGYSGGSGDIPQFGGQVEAGEAISGKKGFDEPDLAAHGGFLEADPGAENIAQAKHLPQMLGGEMFGFGTGSDDEPSGVFRG